MAGDGGEGSVELGADVEPVLGGQGGGGLGAEEAVADDGAEDDLGAGGVDDGDREVAEAEDVAGEGGLVRDHGGPPRGLAAVAASFMASGCRTAGDGAAAAPTAALSPGRQRAGG